MNHIDDRAQRGVDARALCGVGSWAYVVLFEFDKQRVFAWRKINTLNNPKGVNLRQVLFFENHRLVDADDKQVFMIDPRFDFFVFDGTTFVASRDREVIAEDRERRLSPSSAQVSSPASNRVT